MGKPTSTLAEGTEKLGKLVREVRERQHELGGTGELQGPAKDPTETWARKHMSEGFSPDRVSASAPMAAPEKPSAHHQAQFMKELRARAGEHGNHAQSYGKMAMQRPFAPGKSSQPKRSMWSRMTRGS